MQYTTIVDKSEETLNLIIGKAEELDQDRVFNGLDMQHYTQVEMRMLTFEDIDSQEKDQLFCSHTLYFDRRCLTKQKAKNNLKFRSKIGEYPKSSNYGHSSISTSPKSLNFGHHYN